MASISTTYSYAVFINWNSALRKNCPISLIYSFIYISMNSQISIPWNIIYYYYYLLLLLLLLLLKLPRIWPLGALSSWFQCPLDMLALFFEPFLTFWHLCASHNSSFGMSHFSKERSRQWRWLKEQLIQSLTDVIRKSNLSQTFGSAFLSFIPKPHSSYTRGLRWPLRLTLLTTVPKEKNSW